MDAYPKYPERLRCMKIKEDGIYSPFSKAEEEVHGDLFHS
jgi:hypothetical protein